MASRSYSAMGWFTFAVCVAIIAFESMCFVNFGSQYLNGSFLVVYLAIFMYRNYRGMRQARHSTGLHLALLLRVLIFGLYILFGIAYVRSSYVVTNRVIHVWPRANFVFMYTQHTRIGDMYLATSEAAVFSLFCFSNEVVYTSGYCCPPCLRKPSGCTQSVVFLASGRFAQETCTDMPFTWTQLEHWLIKSIVARGQRRTFTPRHDRSRIRCPGIRGSASESRKLIPDALRSTPGISWAHSLRDTVERSRHERRTFGLIHIDFLHRSVGHISQMFLVYNRIFIYFMTRR